METFNRIASSKFIDEQISADSSSTYAGDFRPRMTQANYKPTCAESGRISSWAKLDSQSAENTGRFAELTSTGIWPNLTAFVIETNLH
jgi:hypothetical protein